ncbi:MAG: 4Fe-4S dicluster domain-containing protein [Syntrophorhabdaceae bacterium]|nr:4Fe-4S dicluster domain-containing protein [Syntrophorhabdaceae bacterium]
MYQDKDELMVIKEDIERAIKKKNPRWAMLIDLRRCTSCKACTASCVAEQKSPPGIFYRPVYEEEFGVFPKVKRRFTPRLCNQCDNPPCVAACPNKGKGKATWKSTEGITNGIVMINYEECIGCGLCVLACPYKARNLDTGAFYTEGTPKIEEYEKSPSWEYGRRWPREKYHLPVGVARKCHFCIHRIKEGMLPACVSTCPSRANLFGDIDDRESLIHKTIKANKVNVLKSVKGDGKERVTPLSIRGKSPEEIAKITGYPGKIPVFDVSATTKPRVFYILF